MFTFQIPEGYAQVYAQFLKDEGLGDNWPEDEIVTQSRSLYEKLLKFNGNLLFRDMLVQKVNKKYFQMMLDITSGYSEEEQKLWPYLREFSHKFVEDPESLRPTELAILSDEAASKDTDTLSFAQGIIQKSSEYFLAGTSAKVWKNNLLRQILNPTTTDQDLLIIQEQL